MKNPIKFHNDDVISDVIYGKSPPWACEHDNSAIFHPILTKLGMVDDIWVETNPIDWRRNDVTSDVTVDLFRLK